MNIMSASELLTVTEDAHHPARRTSTPAPQMWDFSWGGLVSRLADLATSSHRATSTGGQASDDGDSQVDPGTSLEAGTRQTMEVQDMPAPSLGGTILRHLSGRSQEGGPSTSEETTAGAAERHRLTGRTLGIDQQSLTQWSETIAPSIFLLLCIFIAQHFIGLIVFGYLTLILAASNDFIQEQNSLKDGRKNLALVGCILGLVAHLPAIIFASYGCLSWRAFLLFIPSHDIVPSVWDCLYCVTTADCFIRICGSVLKMSLLLRSKNAVEDGHGRRRQLLTMVEHWVLFYRACISTPFWFVHLYQGGFVSSIFTGAYLVTKCSLVYKRSTALLASVKMVWRRGAQHGKYVSQEELLELGTSCPICQDTMTRPIMLKCQHAYCDSCIQEWLERGENTCPLCRAAILPAGLQFFGNGATTLLPQLF